MRNIHMYSTYFLHYKTRENLSQQVSAMQRINLGGKKVPILVPSTHILKLFPATFAFFASIQGNIKAKGGRKSGEKNRGHEYSRTARYKRLCRLIYAIVRHPTPMFRGWLQSSLSICTPVPPRSPFNPPFYGAPRGQEGQSCESIQGRPSLDI